MDNRPDNSTAKAIKVFSMVSSKFREKGYLPVLCGGFAVELMTNGGYTTGDIDILFKGKCPSMEEKLEIMRSLGCLGGARIFEVEGQIVDIGGVGEFYSDKFLEFSDEKGTFLVESPEEALAQRLLVSIYPVENKDQADAAKLIVAQAKAGQIPMDWTEARRIAALSWVRVSNELEKTIAEVESDSGEKKEGPIDSAASLSRKITKTSHAV